VTFENFPQLEFDEFGRNHNAVHPEIPVSIANIENVLVRMVLESSDGAVGKFETSVVLTFFQKDDLYVTIVETSNYDYLIID